MGLLMPDSIELVAAKLESLHSDVGEIKSSVNRLSEAVVQLALVEERLATSQASLGRAFKAIERIENRLAALEKSQPHTSAMANRVENAIWALGAVVAVALLKKTGFL